ncbi:hypothetical protein B0H66DRAFT_600197 [Apodospora peruviana]|uniref:Rhodopsin domain-containing protein n=1 Tax=Apodospora peruviana TaxID=516989 RepID=A0AAE0IJ38_9PEZI|nr:hypothetical protein B0H66DRAFT_600197 [Apodospora peruviana]
MDAPPPFVPITDRAALLARVHIGVTIPLLALTLVPFVARIYSRIWPVWRIGFADWLIVIGFASAITDWALLQSEMITTPSNISLEQAIWDVKLAYMAIPIWGLTMTCVKTSIALTLLRIPQTRLSTVFLYLILAFQLIYFVGDTIYIFLKCQPLQAAWDFTVVGGKCLDIRIDVVVSNLGSAMNILTDVFLSLAPMLILWNLRRPLRERILVCFLTGMGLFASLASVVKLIMIQSWGNHPDPWALAMSLASWTIIEQFVAILAACSPSLKGPIQRMLGKFGILLTRYESHISFIHMPTRVGRGSKYERQVDEETGSRPGATGGHIRDGDLVLDKLERDKSTMSGSTSASGTTLVGSGNGIGLGPG